MSKKNYIVYEIGEYVIDFTTILADTLGMELRVLRDTIDLDVHLNEMFQTTLLAPAEFSKLSIFDDVYGLATDYSVYSSLDEHLTTFKRYVMELTKKDLHYIPANRKHVYYADGNLLVEVDNESVFPRT